MLNNLYQSLDPVAFTIGPFSARWYGLAYVAGFICVIAIMYVVGKRWKMRFDFDSLCIIMLCAMIGVIVGGRLGYVLFYNWDMYAANPLAILEFSRGGMSFHGGFIGALVAGIVAARMVHMPYLSLVDLAIIGVPIGLFFGRCANFVNGELWGAPTDLPWGVVFGGSAGMEPRHPSQLYEALLEGALLFAVLFVMSRSARRLRAARILVCSWWGMAFAASLLNLCVSPMLSSVTFGAAGSPWGRCFRCRLLWRA